MIGYGDGSIPGNGAMWTSNRGVCVGLPDGGVRNLTENTYSFPTGQTGTATMRFTDGLTQYIVTQQGQSQVAFNAAQ
jgi:hypothetical protein